jgi:hypothetical protein
MTTQQIKKGDFVLYSNGCGFIRALVKRAHRDGSVTVEPYFFQKADGTYMAGFIGGKFTLGPSDFQSA